MCVLPRLHALTARALVWQIRSRLALQRRPPNGASTTWCQIRQNAWAAMAVACLGEAGPWLTRAWWHFVGASLWGSGSTTLAIRWFRATCYSQQKSRRAILNYSRTPPTMTCTELSSSPHDHPSNPLLAMKPRKSTAMTPKELAANLTACSVPSPRSAVTFSSIGCVRKPS